MLAAEAAWLGRRIQEVDPEALSPMLNIGSSTGVFVTKHQPWIDAHVFRPLRERGVRVVNTDIKAAAGVDLVGDLSDPALLRRLTGEKFKSALCANLLEHVPEREPIARTLSSVVVSGGRLLVSGPHRYPYHPDPIDTMFRPSVEEMAKLFPDTRIITSEIVPCGTYLQYITRTPKKFATSMLRLGLPVYHPRDWLSAVLRLGWLHRTFEVVCVALEKL